MLLKIVVAAIALFFLTVSTNQQRKSQHKIIWKSAPKLNVTFNRTNTPYLGESVLLRCRATGVPTPIVEFGQISSVLFEKKPIAPMGFTEEGILHLFSSFKKTDEGQYYCLANNSKGYDYVEFGMYVNETGVKSFKRYNMTIVPKENIGKVGDNIRINCIVTPYVKKTISWKRYPNENLRSGIVDYGTGELLIRNATVDDSSAYVCTAFASETEEPIDRQVTLVVINDK